MGLDSLILGRYLYNDNILLHVVFVIASLVSLVGQANVAIPRTDGPADGEREFVVQLQSRQLYNLAEQFCVRQSESCQTSDERAVWQMMLVGCRAEHAWNLQGRSKGSGVFDWILSIWSAMVSHFRERMICQDLREQSMQRMNDGAIQTELIRTRTIAQSNSNKSQTETLRSPDSAFSVAACG